MAVVDQGSAGETPQALAALREARTEIAGELAATVRACVRRKDTGHAAFHGCIDWHSAVHGAWALTAYGRMTGDRQDVALLNRILSPANIAQERALLRARPDFEMPYGRAWFLRLASEHALAFKRDTLRPMADDVLGSMLAYYGRHRPDPWRGSYDSDSWALLNMHDYAARTRNAAALEAVGEWVRTHFVRYERACDYGSESGHFMAVCTNWAWLVSRVLKGDAFDRWAAAFLRASGLPRPVMAPVNWHHHGLNFSRAWGLWGMSRATGSSAARQAYRAAFAEHFRATYEHPQRWRGNYEGVAHWVPQFGMLALQPLFD
jgi:hypothetical protein